MGIPIHSELDRDIDPRRPGNCFPTVFDLDSKSDKVAGPKGMSNSRGYANVIYKRAVRRTDVLDVESLDTELA